MRQSNGIIASVDLIEGTVVRLQQGDYERKTRYSVDPLEQLTRYQSDAAQRLHIVDLDGARNPSCRQTALIAHLVQELDVSVQVGGGIRSEEDVAALLKAGVARVVVGSVAVTDVLKVREWFKKFGGDRLVIALDCKTDAEGRAFVATNAWKNVSGVTVQEMIQGYRDSGLKHVLCTDVSKDGLLKGSNVTLYRELVQNNPDLCVQASGGIGSLEDVRDVARTGADGVIIGRALLEERFTVKEAVKCWQSASSPV